MADTQRSLPRWQSSPRRAREVIADGKMAVILGIETSNLFDCFLVPSDEYPAGGNWQGVCNDELDALFAEALQTADEQARAEMYHPIAVPQANAGKSAE